MTDRAKLTAALQKAFGLPPTTSADTTFGVAMMAMETAAARRKAAADRSAALDADPAFQARLAAAQLEELVASEMYSRWAAGEAPPPSATYDQVKATPGYQRWAQD